MNYIRKNILQQEAYRLKPIQVQHKLNQNEFPEDLPEAIRLKISQKVSELSLNRYPEYRPFQLIAQLADLHLVTEDQIAVSNGSNVLVQALVIVAAVQGKVLVLEPSFSVYGLEAALLGNSVIRYELDPNTYDFNLEKLLSLIEKEKPNLIFIANPNAPTGNVFAQEKLLQVIEHAPCLVVIDEAYAEFSGVSLIDYVKKYENLVVLRTLSKAYALGGLRVGYAIAQAHIAEQINKVLLPYSVSQFAQETALLLLEAKDLLKKRVTWTLQQRDLMLQKMRAYAQLKVIDSAANFIFFQYEKAQHLFDHLLENSVLIRNVSCDYSPNALRVSVGLEEQNRLFLELLEQYFTSTG